MGRALRLGLQSPYFGATVGGGEKYLAVTARALKDAHGQDRVEILGAVPPDRALYESMLNVDLEGIELRGTNRRVTPLHRAFNRVRALRPLRDAVLGRQALDASRNFDVHLAMCYAIPVATRAAHAAVLCQFPYPDPDRAQLDRFAQVICQSEYVRGWVARRWGRDATVVNPPIDVPISPPDLAVKRNWIVGVGRFIRSGHSKRQDLLVQVFRDLVDGGLRDWELHLAGSVHRDAEHAGYFEEVQAMAAGYPIVFHPDAPLAELNDLYDAGSIFWHAAGHGADSEHHPERLEHFGMTTVEAMGHGCVPVAIALGGQPEIVESGRDGLLWREPAELASLTTSLIQDGERRRGIAVRARETALLYSRPVFMRRIRAALAPLLDQARSGLSTS